MNALFPSLLHKRSDGKQWEVQLPPWNVTLCPARFVTVGDVRFAYRRFGKPSGTPLVFRQHFRGSMDNWDPALLNGFAKDRTVITFDTEP